jgi:hypothetical protein
LIAHLSRARAGLRDAARLRSGSLDLGLGAHPGGGRPPDYELDELAALGGLAVDAILRDDERGAAVAPGVTCLLRLASCPSRSSPGPAIR